MDIPFPFYCDMDCMRDGFRALWAQALAYVHANPGTALLFLAVGTLAIALFLSMEPVVERGKAVIVSDFVRCLTNGEERMVYAKPGTKLVATGVMKHQGYEETVFVQATYHAAENTDPLNSSTVWVSRDAFL